MKGKIKWFDPHMHYGFIINEDGEEIYVNTSSEEDVSGLFLMDGDQVEFRIVKDPTGPVAKDIVKSKNI